MTTETDKKERKREQVEAPEAHIVNDSMKSNSAGSSRNGPGATLCHHNTHFSRISRRLVAPHDELNILYIFRCTYFVYIYLLP